MATCSTCKWWDEVFRIVNGASIGHRCLLMSDNEYPPDSGLIVPKEKHQKLAKVSAYEPSDVFTQAEFGCVQWEVNDEQT